MTQYDLAGNPLPDDNDNIGAAVPSTPMSPVWPPPVQGGGYPGYGMEETNTSGTETTVPPEILAFRWSWGAFFMNWIWCFSHRLPLWGAAVLGTSLLSMVPFVNFVAPFAQLGIIIYLALNGHQLAWKSRRFEGGVPQFIEVQRAWMKWGIGLGIVFPFVIAFLAAILFPIFANARERARATSSGSPMMISAPCWNFNENTVR